MRYSWNKSQPKLPAATVTVDYTEDENDLEAFLRGIGRNRRSQATTIKKTGKTIVFGSYSLIIA